MAPVVDRLTEEYKGSIEVRRLNVDNDEQAAELASLFRVQYVPTFVFLNADGTTADVLVGEVSEDALREAIEALK